jgi:hypothetical protein
MTWRRPRVTFRTAAHKSQPPRVGRSPREQFMELYGGSRI